MVKITFETNGERFGIGRTLRELARVADRTEGRILSYSIVGNDGTTVGEMVIGTD